MTRDTCTNLVTVYRMGDDMQETVYLYGDNILPIQQYVSCKTMSYLGGSVFLWEAVQLLGDHTSSVSCSTLVGADHTKSTDSADSCFAYQASAIFL